MRLFLIPVLVTGGCVVEEIPVAPGVGSFVVELVSIDPLTTPGCETAPIHGGPDCLRPFPEEDTPVHARIRATALDRSGKPMADYQGSAIIDLQPGRLHGVGPGGLVMSFQDGVAETDLDIVYAFGPTRIWVEDCGSNSAGGSFATGVSGSIWFERPRLDQLNATEDNTTSPMTPRPTNVCAISGDPRYGLGVDPETGEATFVGYSQGGAVNAPPPAMGNFVEVNGCTREEYDALGSCEKGPLIVTAIANEGFYVTDINANAAARGFNHIYAFNFNYPENLEVGDIVVSVRGTPVEFAGSTQFSNPIWTRDGVRLGADLLPTPVTITPADYLAAVKSYGRNRSEILDLEKLEGALVCFEGLAPSSTLTTCDVNQSGGIERQGCLVDCNDPLPPLCEVGMGTAPLPPHCDETNPQPYCLPLTDWELEECGLSCYLPSNAAEYCCERICYDDPLCTEESSYSIYGQWVADVYGNYDRGDSPPVKIALITRDADPDFDPLAFGTAQREKPDEERQTVRVIGNLRQVLAARPVWVVIARSPADIEIDGTCP